MTASVLEALAEPRLAEGGLNAAPLRGVEPHHLAGPCHPLITSSRPLHEFSRARMSQRCWHGGLGHAVEQLAAVLRTER
jgi:hypothetical protein